MKMEYYTRDTKKKVTCTSNSLLQKAKAANWRDIFAWLPTLQILKNIQKSAGNSFFFFLQLILIHGYDIDPLIKNSQLVLVKSFSA